MCGKQEPIMLLEQLWSGNMEEKESVEDENLDGKMK